MLRKVFYTTFTIAMTFLATGRVFAQNQIAVEAQVAGQAEAYPPSYGPQDTQGTSPPIPPYIEGDPIPSSGGGFCFDGPHPVDARMANGATWDNATGRHIHPYPPFDLRLFTFQNSCYYFIGDPGDFGYAGESYSYYGAHPVHATYGGGWCFMIGGHHHLWRPWSPHFTTVGPWFYWEGPYDPFFWTYWPYYSFYYRSHYSRYYGGGAYLRGHAIAPRITHVPQPPRNSSGWQGPRQSGVYRAAPGAGYRAAPGAAPGYRAAPAPQGAFGGHGTPSVAPRGFSAPRSISPPSGGGGRFGGGSFRGGGGGHFRR